jgi:hypothetical protein
MAVACNDVGVSAYNASPAALITSHADGEEVHEGQQFTVRGSASDPDDSLSSLTTRWYVEGVVVCDGIAPDGTGISSCDLTLYSGQSKISLEVTDPGGSNVSASVILTLIPNAPPMAQISSPTTAGIYYSDQLITFSGLVSDPDESPVNLTASWNSSIDGDLTVPSIPDTAGEVLGSGYLTEGEHFVTLNVVDSSAQEAADSVTLTIGPPNTAPSCEITNPKSGGSSTNGDEVGFQGIVGDVDVSVDLLSVEWSSDKDGLMGASTPNTGDGTVEFYWDDLSVNTHVVTLTVTDEVGGVCTSSVVHSVDEPPEVEITLPIDGAVVQQGEFVIFEATVSDNEDQPDDLTLEWSSNVSGVLSTDSANSSGNASFSTNDLSAGSHQVTLSALDTDGLDNDDAIFITINAPPVVDSIIITPSIEVTATSTLTCTATGTDPEDGTISPSYAWQNLSNGWSYIGSPVTLTAADASPGDEIVCTATVTDSAGATASDTASVFVENSAPSIKSVTITPLSAVAGDDLACTYAGFVDTDLDADASTFTWSVNGVTEPTTSATLSSVLVYGDTVECTVTPFDGIDFGAPMTDSLTIGNTAPVLTDVTLSPDPAYEDTTLTCTPGGATDADGAEVTFSYVWYVNTLDIGEAANVLTGSDFNKGDDVQCGVIPDDGTDVGVAVASDVVTISNTAPTLTGAEITPSTPSTADTLVCAGVGWADIDGDVDDSTFRWLINGKPVSTGDTIVGLFDRYDEVTCEVTAHDGETTGNTVSTSVTITNGPPEIISVTLPAMAYTNDTIMATVIANDGDGDAITLGYDWSVNGKPVGVSGNSLDGTLYFSKADEISVEVVANDGVLSSPSFSMIGPTILNTPPTAPVLAFSPSVPEAEVDDMVCLIATPSVDADGDTISYEFSWLEDGFPFEGMTDTTVYSSDTISSVETYLHEEWTCDVTPSDDEEDGGTGTISVTILGPDGDGDGVRLGEDCDDEDPTIWDYTGGSAGCAAASCAGILAEGNSVGDGVYYIDPTGTLTGFEAYCVMDATYDGGGWALSAVISDDTQDTWTWEGRDYWSGRVTTFGALDELAYDFKSRVQTESPVEDIAFIHQPSGEWAAYNAVSALGAPLSYLSLAAGESQCLSGGDGYSLSAGTITASGDLCSTDLYFNPADHDGDTVGVDCLDSENTSHAFGPAWSAGWTPGDADGCPFDDPGTTSSLGPSSESGETLYESSALGFGAALGLNTGAAGGAENYIWVLVR